MTRRGAGRSPALGIDWLLTGTTPNAFLGEVFDRKPMVLGGRPAGFYGNLLRFEDLDTIFNQNGGDVAKRLTVTRGNTQYFATDDRPKGTSLMLRDAFAQGYTVALAAAEESWLPIKRLAGAIAEFLTCSASATIFLTPIGNQGLPRHFDTYDTIVLQLDGQKEWRLYDEEIAAPLERQWYRLDADPEPAPRQTLTLRPGDLLYLPRGVPHAARAGDTPSLHVTFALLPYLWKDFLIDMIDEAAETHAPLRRAASVMLPHRGRRAAPPELVVRLLAALAPASQEAALERARERLVERLVERLAPLPGTLFPRRPERSAVGPDDRLRRVPGAIASVRRRAKDVVLAFPGDSLRAPLPAEAALRAMARATKSFAVSALPGPLSDQSKCILASRLVKIGFLEIVGAGKRR